MPMEHIRPVILIVDDEPANIEVLNAALGSDYEVLAATNGRDALRLAMAERPALILLDIVMPGTDGYAICRQLKADIRTSGVPVIFITALKEFEARAQSILSGANDLIAKPASVSELALKALTHVIKAKP